MMSDSVSKSCRAWIEVDLVAIKKNYQLFCELAKKSNGATTLVAVIKADAYGHGALTVAKTLEAECRCECFAVATYDEAIELREGGINAEIIVLGYVDSGCFDGLIERNIMPTIYQYEQAVALNERARKMSRVANAQIAIDTGMARIGFRGDKCVSQINEIFKMPCVKVSGIFTHFADAEGDEEYTFEQIKKMKKIVESLQAPCNFDIHMSNSVAIVEGFDCTSSRARVGLGLYGYLDGSGAKIQSALNQLEPAMTFKTRVVNIQEIKAGESVGYGRAFVASEDMRIATLSVGYADGYRLCLSVGASVLVGGHFAKVLGRICMDMTMIDITGIDKISIGDEVVLWGKNHDNAIHVDNLASGYCSTYELLCGISKRVKRVYIKNEENT